MNIDGISTMSVSWWSWIGLSEAENSYISKNAQPGLEKCGSYKKKLDNQLDDGCRMNRGLIERSGGTAQFKEMAESKIEKVASFRIGNTSKTEKTGWKNAFQYLKENSPCIEHTYL